MNYNNSSQDVLVGVEYIKLLMDCVFSISSIFKWLEKFRLPNKKLSISPREKKLCHPIKHRNVSSTAGTFPYKLYSPTKYKSSIID